MANFLTRLFGSRNQRLLRQFSKVVKKINELEEGIKALSDEELAAKTPEFRERVEQRLRQELDRPDPQTDTECTSPPAASGTSTSTST